MMLEHVVGHKTNNGGNIYKPMALVTMYGFLPIILVGIWFGISIKKKGDKIIRG